MPRKSPPRGRVLVLWNFVGKDEYEELRDGVPLPWNPEEMSAEVGTDAEEVDSIVDALRAVGFTARAVNIEENLEKLVAAIRKFKPDIVFNLIEYFNDSAVQEAYVAGLYRLMGVPFTGADPLCLLTCQRKFRTKVLLEAQGLPTPASRLVTARPVPRSLGLRYPLIVKPAREDASGGIDAQSVVYGYHELRRRIEYVLDEFGQPALVERYIAGREIHVALLGNPPIVLPLLEMEFSSADPARPKILTYEAKWDPLHKDFYSLDVRVPVKGLGRAVSNRIKDVAKTAYQIMECRDYARIDMRLDDDGTPYILEVNPNPNLAEGTGFMLCAEHAGWSFEAIVNEIVEMALLRQRPPEPPAPPPGAVSSDPAAVAAAAMAGAAAPPPPPPPPPPIRSKSPLRVRSTSPPSGKPRTTSRASVKPRSTSTRPKPTPPARPKPTPPPARPKPTPPPARPKATTPPARPKPKPKPKSKPPAKPKSTSTTTSKPRSTASGSRSTTAARPRPEGEVRR